MRALLLVLDGMGCGAAPDAHAYGDDGANTLGRIFHLLPTLELPTLFSLGLRRILTGRNSPSRRNHQLASHGRMQPLSPGKNSITGHWEMAGVILKQPFATFNRLPRPFLAELESETGTRFLGNQSLASARVLKKLGEAHLRTGRPILSILPDSAIQIAAHEESFGLQRLYTLCVIVRHLVNPLKIGRVIARPFVGTEVDGFVRTGNRKDFAIPPKDGTILDRAAEAGREIVTIGKIGDIFTHGVRLERA
jgi:phosphopentomutase